MRTLFWSAELFQTFFIFIVYPLWNMVNAKAGYERYNDVNYVGGHWYDMKIIPMVCCCSILWALGAMLLVILGGV